MGWTIFSTIAYLLCAAGTLVLAAVIIWAVRQANRRHSEIRQRCPINPARGVQCARDADHMGSCLISPRDLERAGYHPAPF